MARNLTDYQQQYKDLPFEGHQATLRRNALLKTLHGFDVKSIAEVGCGLNPLFSDFDKFEQMVVVEPGELFASNAAELKKTQEKSNDITIVQSLLEDVSNAEDQFDVVVLSALLHEVPSVENFLQAAARIGCAGCKYVITVPNAQSFHRQLALRNHLIDDLFAISQQQTDLQQQRTYDLESLQEELLKFDFVIEAASSIIFKPFTHLQMQKLIDNNILTEEQVYDLCEMVDLAPAFGSELLVIASNGKKNV